MLINMLPQPSLDNQVSGPLPAVSSRPWLRWQMLQRPAQPAGAAAEDRLGLGRLRWFAGSECQGGGAQSRSPQKPAAVDSFPRLGHGLTFANSSLLSIQNGLPRAIVTRSRDSLLYAIAGSRKSTLSRSTYMPMPVALTYSFPIERAWKTGRLRSGRSLDAHEQIIYHARWDPS